MDKETPTPQTADHPTRQAAHSKEPWSACNEGKCKCGQIWSKTEDYPVATVVLGKWGDDYPSIRFVNGDSEGSIGAKVEAYSDMIEYGEVPEEVAFANAERIVSCVNALEGISNPAAVKQVIEAARLVAASDDFAMVKIDVALAALDAPPKDTEEE